MRWTGERPASPPNRAESIIPSMNEAKRNTCPDASRDCELSRACGNSTDRVRPWLFGVAEQAAKPSLSTVCRAAVDAGFAGIDYAVTALPQALGDTTASSQAAETIEEGTQDCGLHAVTLVTTLGRLVETQQTVRSWLGLNSGHPTGWLTLALNGENATSSSESAVAGTDSEIGNRLYKLLSGLRFDIESSGVTIAIDADAIQPQLGAIALRELVDSVGSSAIGICARIEFGGVQEDPATLLSPLNYRVSVVRICVERATGGDDVGVEFIRQIAPAFRQALAAVRTHSPIIVEGTPDPLATRAAIESLWVP